METAWAEHCGLLGLRASTGTSFVDILLLKRYLKSSPRMARIDAPGALHHIVIRGIERRSLFEDNRDRDESCPTSRMLCTRLQAQS